MSESPVRIKILDGVSEQIRALNSIQDELREMLERSFGEWVVETRSEGPGRGFTGLLSVSDEVRVLEFPWVLRGLPTAFSPVEFKRFWDSCSEQSKVYYVLSLINQPRGNR